MDARALATILTKVAGIAILVVCIGQLPSYFSVMTRGSEWSLAEVLGAAGITLGPTAILGLALWYFPNSVANKIVSGGVPPEPSTEPHYLELAAFALLGVYLVARGVVNLGYDIAFAIILGHSVPDLPGIPPNVLASAVAAAIQIAIGVGLCIGGRGIVRIIRGMRG